MKVIIVGGVAGGASAAARLRRLDEQAEITIYERSGYISYANCGLPYYLGEVIKDKKDLTLQTPESFLRRFNITAKVNHEVLDIDPNAKTVTVRNGETGEEFQDSYDKLILSPGAKAAKSNIPGIDAEKVFTLRTVEDTFRIYDYIKESCAKSVVIAGGGFIGLEAAENLKELGLAVTIVQSRSQMFPALDQDMATQIHALLREQGINLVFDNKVVAIEENEEGLDCVLSQDERVSADMVLFAIGVVPDTELAQKAGLAMGTKGSIAVNSRMESSVPDIYAVGDAVEVSHFVTGDKAVISLAGPANKQGRIAADNIAGGNSRYQGTQGSLVIKLFDMTAAATGLNEKQAQAAGIEYEKVILSPPSHASYYPGSTAMTMKVLFERRKNKILGAQIVGKDGVDKRIDVIATAIRAGMKATDLAELELAYAPPYASAKDPVNMAGFIIENIVTGKVRQFHHEDIEALLSKQDVTLLDTRTQKEYEAGHIEGFVNIPVDELRNRIDELPQGKPVYVMCQSGARSYIASRILSERGFESYNFAGGYRYYSMLEQERLINAASYDCGMDK
ncbi:MAG: CoA-disulfide reductase [Raoultibacter sp.]|jgi:NADPH-dependent 2,4-dienoyl-CoA reductase/sulfur reductase-like enzyme/rhodanese-related sulfurtransferase